MLSQWCCSGFQCSKKVMCKTGLSYVNCLTTIYPWFLIGPSVYLAIRLVFLSVFPI
jgi:hypothetical protein